MSWCLPPGTRDYVDKQNLMLLLLVLVLMLMPLLLQQQGHSFPDPLLVYVWIHTALGITKHQLGTFS